MREGIQARRVVQFGHDHQIEQAVVNQRIGAKRYATSGLPAIPDRKREETSFPRKPFRAKSALTGREIRKVRESRYQIGQSAQPSLKLGVCFDGDARAEAARDEVDERRAVEKTHVDPSRRCGRRDPQRGCVILDRQARGMSKVVRGPHGKNPERTLIRQTSGKGGGKDLVDGAVTAAGDNAVDFAAAGVGDGFCRQSCGIACLPGHPHLRNVAILPERVNGCSHARIAGCFAMKNNANVGHRLSTFRSRLPCKRPPPYTRGDPTAQPSRRQAADGDARSEGRARLTQRRARQGGRVGDGRGGGARVKLLRPSGRPGMTAR